MRPGILYAIAGLGALTLPFLGCKHLQLRTISDAVAIAADVIPPPDHGGGGGHADSSGEESGEEEPTETLEPLEGAVEVAREEGEAAWSEEASDDPKQGDQEGAAEAEAEEARQDQEEPVEEEEPPTAGTAGTVDESSEDAAPTSGKGSSSEDTAGGVQRAASTASLLAKVRAVLKPLRLPAGSAPRTRESRRAEAPDERNDRQSSASPRRTAGRSSGPTATARSSPKKPVAAGASVAQLAGQVRKKGSLMGTVLDQGDKPIAQALVTLGTFKAYTDTRGRFTFAGLTQGTHKVTVKKQGWQPASTSVQVSAVKPSQASLRLTREARSSRSR